MIPRIDITNSIFNNNSTSTTEFTIEQTIEMKKLFFALDKKLTFEMQHQTDAIFLEKYIQENLVPRGLRINLAPTFLDDEDFANSWVKILDHCSFELLKLLISKRNYLSEKATEEINLISFNL